MIKIRVLLGIILNYTLDCLFYIKYSGIFYENKEEKILAKLTFFYHSIEKGLSMPNIKLGFGRSKIERMLTLLNHYVDRDFDNTNSQFIATCSVLRKYYDLHEKEKYELKKFFSTKDYNLIRLYSVDRMGGTIEIHKSNYFSATQNSFDEFVKSRHSVRSFSNKLVEPIKLRRVVELANFCPSACNRQSCKVYSIIDKTKVEQILNIQKGIDSTAKFVYQLLILTSNRNYFFTSGERNQLFVDGGIFLESLLLSLHFENIAACPLHWSLNYSHDKKIKKIVGLRSEEKVIALVAIGYLNEDIKVPASQRKQINEIFKNV